MYLIKRLYLIIISTLTILLQSSIAHSYCYEPNMYSIPPSSPGYISKPTTPFCFMNYNITRKHTCDSWEIDNYISEVNQYIRDLNDFATEANSYANAAIDFANSASEYVVCEVREVKSELE